MPKTDVANKRLPIMPTRKSGMERYEFILDCAEQLLKQGSPEEINIYEVADRAELAVQSVYRIFPSAAAVNYALAQRFLNGMADAYADMDISDCQTWQQIVEKSCRFWTAFYNSHPHAMELLLGSGVIREVRESDRQIVTLIAERLQNRLRDMGLIDVNIQLEKQIEIAIEILDATWSRSYYSDGKITDFYLRESVIAVIAYLELYLPRYSTYRV